MSAREMFREVPLPALGMVSVSSAKLPSFAARLHEAVGMQLPASGRVIQAHGVALASVGVGRYLLIQTAADASGMERVRSFAHADAAFTEYSDGLIVFRLQGSGWRNVLQQVAFIDLHPSVVTPCTCLVTRMGSIRAFIWLLDDANEAFVGVPPSLVGSFLDMTHACLPSASD